MKINLEDIDDLQLKFNLKLQIELYNLAEKTMVNERKEEFKKYMEERKEKIRKMLNIDHGEIYEAGERIFEF